MPARWIVLALLAAPFLLPASAHALGVRVEQEQEFSRDGSYLVARVVAVAEPAEVNDLRVDVTGAGAAWTVRVRDERAPVTAGAGCEAVGPQEVRCPLDLPLRGASVLAGDLDDRVRVTGGATVSGGPGNDDLSGPGPLSGDAGDDRLAGGDAGVALEGGPGDDEVLGGEGADQLHGGGGRDVLRGGPGDDRLADQDGAAPGPDTLDGGPGRDIVDYAGHRGAIVLALPGGRSGEAGEGDTLSSFESASGGDGPDVLTGTAGANALAGGAGADRLAGGPGADELDGGGGPDALDGGADADRLDGEAGDDALLGGPGADSLAGGPGEDGLEGGGGPDALTGGALADRLAGGPGRDSIGSAGDFFRDEIGCGSGSDRAEIDRGERPAGCERRRISRPTFVPDLSGDLSSATPREGPVYRVRRGRTRLLLDCLDLGLLCEARVTATVRSRGRRVVVLRGRVRCGFEPGVLAAECDYGETERARVTMAGRRLLRERGRLRARATIHLDPGPARGALPIPGRLVLRR